MRVIYSETFKDGYKKLSKTDQNRVARTIRLLCLKKTKNLFYPSLRAKRVQGTSDIWEASVTMRIRITFQLYADTLYLRVVGDHDRALGRP